MKRTIIILSFFLLIMAASAFEIVFSTMFYTELHGKLHEVKQSIEVDINQIDRQECKQLMENVEKKWESARKVLMIIGNHNVSKVVDEKLVSLREYIRTNNYTDGIVALEVSMQYIHDLITDTFPSFSNLL